MGRGRGKGKKQSSIAARDDNASGDDEKLPVRRRGRPQKPLKDDIENEEYEVDKIEQEKIDKDDSKVLNKDTKNQTVSENIRKRKRHSEVKENVEENGVVIKTNSNELIKSVGYRQNGSRRKNKPRRAAEVGVECK